MAYKLNVFTGTLDVVNSGSGSGVSRVGNTVDRHITIWDGNNADTIKNSQAIVQAGGAIEAQGFITNRSVTGTVQVNTGQTWIAPSLVIEPGAVVVLASDAQLIIL